MPETAESPSRQLRYDFAIENVDTASHYGRLAHLVGHNKKVLELGCNTGYISQVLGQQFNCQVWGLEIDEQAAEQARSRCQEVICGDLDLLDLTAAYKGHKFDVVLCGDVIEHLRTPEKTLKQIHDLLAPGGRIIISIPNCTHASIRLALLSGHFPYRPMGLLDDTHLRFFNRATLELLLDGCGFKVLSVGRNRWHTFDSEIGKHLSTYPQAVLDSIYRDPEAETFQFIIEATPKVQPQPVAANQVMDFSPQTYPVQAVSVQTESSDTQSETPAALPFVDVLVFEEAGLPIDDRFQQYLNILDYPRNAITFHWVKDGKLAGLTNAPDGTPTPFGEHEFQRFRFANPFSVDAVEPPQQTPKAQAFSKAAVVRMLSTQLRGDLLFVMSTHSYPTGQCLRTLVEHMQADPDCALVAATPELAPAELPLADPSGTTSWVSLDCTLARREAIAKVAAGSANLPGDNTPAEPSMPAPFDSVCLSWDTWLAGSRVARLPKATFFYCGVPSWSEQWTPSLAARAHETAGATGAGAVSWPHPVFHSAVMAKYASKNELSLYALRLLRRSLRKPHVDSFVALLSVCGAWLDGQSHGKRLAAPAPARPWVKFSGPSCTSYGPSQ